MMAAPLNGLTIAAAQTMLALLRQRHKIEPFEVRDPDDVRWWHCAHDGLRLDRYGDRWVHDPDDIRLTTSVARRII